MPMFTLAELEAVVPLVRRVVPPTPLHAWPLLARRTGAKVWVKHENHSPIGAFKIRGGVVYLDALLRREPKVAGVVTATRGNHGQSIALAASSAGMPVHAVRAARQLAREERGDAGLRRRADRGGRRFRRERGACRALCSSARLSLRALVSSRSGQGRRHLRAGNVPGHARPRRRLRADRHGLRPLRLDHGPRPARARDADHRRRGGKRGGRRALLRGRPARADQLGRHLRRRHGLPHPPSRGAGHHAGRRGAHRARARGRDRGRYPRLLRGHPQSLGRRRRGGAGRPDAGEGCHGGQARRPGAQRRQHRPRGVRRGACRSARPMLHAWARPPQRPEPGTGAWRTAIQLAAPATPSPTSRS